MADVTYKIQPPIGVARVGNSLEFYIGPESPAGLPENLNGSPFGPGDFRDGQGKMKRQAARFQIFRHGPDGVEPIDLGSPGVVDIRWRVHLASKKPIWYTFSTNLGEDGYASDHPLRNADVVEESQRIRMMTDPGPRTVNGPDASAEFDRASTPDADNRFPPKGLKPFEIDTLGGVRTDSTGRLLVLGGHGCSGTLVPGQVITGYANNDGWYDDTSDGPVQAVVVLEDAQGNIQEIEAEAAWTLVTPPAYAPQVENLVTLYDTIFDVMVRKLEARPDIYENGLWKSAGPDAFTPHFETDILPILKRGSTYPWVVAIPPKPHRFDFKRLANPDPSLAGMRRRILSFLRPPSQVNTLIDNDSGATMMPYLAGDACIGDVDKTASKFLKLTDTQYFMLQQWADGHFTSGPANAPADNPAEALTRGVLVNCVGGAFSPGIEMTWVSRLPEIYAEPFRIRVKPDVSYPLSLGWDPEAGLEPGDVTKFMAVPWQADFNECSSQPIGERIIWWWPPQRPSFVYVKKKEPAPGSEGDTIAQRVERGEIEQVPWVGTDYNMNAGDFIAFAQDLDMVKKWMNLGFVYNEGNEEQPLFVEVGRIPPQRSVADPVADGDGPD